MVVVYAIGHLSGAHINPAVTVGFAAAGHFDWRHVPQYVASQIAGATCAALLLRVILGSVAELGATVPHIAAGKAVLLEALLTLVLMLVISAVATDVRAAGRTAGVAIGGTIGLNSLWAGPLTGASMNPARSLGPALAGGGLDVMWVYVLGPVAGAVAGALLYEILAGRPLSGVVFRPSASFPEPKSVPYREEGSSPVSPESSAPALGSVARSRS